MNKQLHRRNKRTKHNLFALRDAAWQFAYAVLWKDQEFEEDELRRVKEYILAYLREAPHRKKAFIAFCERVILTEKYTTAKAGRYVPAPGVWFNRKYQYGFVGTKSWYLSIEYKRGEVPGYLQHLTVLANAYYLYALYPSANVFQSCRKKLISLNAKSVLQHFCNAIVHLNHASH